MRELNSLELKLIGIRWLRESKDCILQCTEFGDRWLADVVGFDGKDLIEIEVKVDYNDFLNEFVNKRRKHDRYISASKTGDVNICGCDTYIPNYLYYLVGSEPLAKRVKGIIEKEQYPYGVLLVQNDEISSYHRVKRLHDKLQSKKCLKRLISRMSNEHYYSLLNTQTYLQKELREFFLRMIENQTKVCSQISNIESVERD